MRDNSKTAPRIVINLIFWRSADNVSIYKFWLKSNSCSGHFALKKPSYVHLINISTSKVLRNYTLNIYLFWYSSINWKRDNIIGILCKLWAGWPRDRGSSPVRDKRLFTSATYPEWIWGRTSLQFNIPEMFPLGQSDRCVKLTTVPPHLKCWE